MYVVKHHSYASHPPTLFSTILQTPFPLYLTLLPYHVLDSSPCFIFTSFPPPPLPTPTLSTFSSPLLYLTFLYYILDPPYYILDSPPPPPPSSSLFNSLLVMEEGGREMRTCSLLCTVPVECNSYCKLYIYIIGLLAC